ncbi:TGF-beta-activated kinase 1 and MAP3K7-binding protein 1-like [Ornithodoros turicata]|uniref:Putative mitogen-activated protein n=1 Tax=Ornithodoros turicata TaxID=34597 RepID=A0A2R5LKA0_9ACAR
MPTRAESRSSRQTSCQETVLSWTDDLPVCPSTGVGTAVNQVYREDGYRKEEHPFEDRTFRFRHDGSTSLYGVLDGDGGTRAADFTLQRFPAELLLGQLDGKTDDQVIKDILQQAFLFVEKGFYEEIDMLLLNKATMQLQLQSVSAYDVLTKYPNLASKLEQVNAEVATGTCAIVALLRCNRLYVANVGTCRALLVKSKEGGRGLEVVQLSVDHSLANADELLRLISLGLSPSKLRGGAENAKPLRYTRCLGNCSLKGDYKENALLRSAEEEPVIADPEICGGVEIDGSCLFLMLMSTGLYQSLEEAGFQDGTNEELAQMTVQEFRQQTTLDDVAQGVVDRVVRLHRDRYMSGTDAANACQKRQDISLLIRNFNQPLGSPAPSRTPNTPESPSETLSGTFSSSRSSSEAPRTLFKTTRKTIPVDEDGRIRPYVDFSDFYGVAEEAQRNGTWPSDLEQ